MTQVAGYGEQGDQCKEGVRTQARRSVGQDEGVAVYFVSV